MGIWDDIVRTFRSGNNLTKLIYINTAVFLLMAVAAIIGFLMNNQVITENALSVLAVPADLNKLIYRPWTLITYMFTHKDILHILFNMLWLYWFGRIFLEYLDQRKLVAVYLLGGITGAVVYVASFNIFLPFGLHGVIIVIGYGFLVFYLEPLTWFKECGKEVDYPVKTFRSIPALSQINCIQIAEKSPSYMCQFSSGIN